MKLSENPVFHDKSKHIEIKYHYIRDMLQRGAVKLQYVVMEEQIADVLMKPLSTSGRSLVFSKSRFPPRESDESQSHSNEQVRCKG